MYFYRDSHGNEIDLVIDSGTRLLPIEIKSATTFSNNFFKGFEYWNVHMKNQTQGIVIYGGDTTQNVQKNMLVSWKELQTIFNTIE